MIKILPVSLSWLLTVGAGSASATQQTPPFYVLDPIVVTATRTATPLSLVGSSVEIVSGEDLRKRGATTLLEALATVPGIAITRNGPAAGTGSLYLRGGKTEHLLVLIDGVEVNDPMSPGGAFDWNTLSVEAIERVEIVKGPQSTLYGSDAMAGVVNIITRAPAGARQSLSLEVGGNRSLHSTLGGSGTVATTSYSFEVSRRQLGGISGAATSYDGNSEEDAWNMWSAAMKVTHQLGTGMLEATLRGSRSRFDIDDFGGPYGDDPNSHSWKADLTGILVWRSEATGPWAQRLVLGGSRTHRWGIDNSDSAHPDERVESDFRGRIQSGEWHNTLTLKGHRLAFGSAGERESGSSRFSSTQFGGTYEERVPESEQWATSLYLQDQVVVAGAAVTVGTRLDHYTDYGMQPTMRVAAARSVGPATVRSSLGTGFRAPSLYQRFSPLYGSVDLEAERSVAWDAGLTTSFAERGTIEVTYYRQEVKDLIDFVTDPVTYVSTFRNRGKVHLSGWEVSATYVLSSRLAIDGGLTLMTATDLSNDLALLRRPDRMLNLDLRFEPSGRWSGFLGLRHVGEREDLDFSLFPSSRVKLERVTLLEGGLSLKLTNHLTLRFRGENLTNEVPEWVWGYGSRRRALHVGLILNR
jgi:vitamin B12 transporter